MGFFLRERSHSARRRFGDMCRLCATGAIAHFGSLGRLILRAPTITRPGAFETHEDRVVTFTGPTLCVGPFVCRFRKSVLRVRGDARRIAYLFLDLQELHFFSRRRPPSCRRSRVQRRHPLCPRTICVFAQACSTAPIMLFGDLNDTFLRGPDMERSANLGPLHSMAGP